MEKDPSPEQIRQRKDILVVIVGAGYSGLCAAIRLKRERIRFILIEKSETVGGTWWDNKYPGCACDVMSHLYSLSFKPNAFWSSSFPSQPEIQTYLEDTADYYGIRQHVKFGWQVETCNFDKELQKWFVKTTAGEVIQCNYLISGIGALHVPKFPNLKGMDTFEGENFHTAQWKKDFDWSGKRVGVIGTGCSAIQVVPSIAQRCKDLFVFQRTPSWVVPRPNFPYPYIIQKCFQYLPFVMKFHRLYIFFRGELFFQIAFNKGSNLGQKLKELASKLMKDELNDPELKEKLVPEYDIGCKRVTISNEYLPAFNRANVHLITDSINEITKNSIHVNTDEISNKEIELDAIIYATGFDVMNSLKNMDVKSPSDGRALAEIWGETPNAYLGIMAPEFPNLFILLGPATGLGHNSVIWMIERQVNFVVNAITNNIDHGHQYIEVTDEANTEYQSYIKETSNDRVFSSGCNSWYQNADGFTFILWPSNCIQYWWKTLMINYNHFKLS